eukprot:scaffold7946_cov116-Isochrysis_galbana.AAC.2
MTRRPTRGNTPCKVWLEGTLPPCPHPITPPPLAFRPARTGHTFKSGFASRNPSTSSSDGWSVCRTHPVTVSQSRNRNDNSLRLGTTVAAGTSTAALPRLSLGVGGCALLPTSTGALLRTVAQESKRSNSWLKTTERAGGGKAGGAGVGRGVRGSGKGVRKGGAKPGGLATSPVEPT